MARTAAQSARVCDNHFRLVRGRIAQNVFLIVSVCYSLLLLGKSVECLSDENLNDTAAVIIFGDQLSRVRQQVPNFDFGNNDGDSTAEEYAASVIEAPKVNPVNPNESGRRFDDNSYSNFRLSSDEIFRHLFINKNDQFKAKAKVPYTYDSGDDDSDSNMQLNIESLFNLRQKNIDEDEDDVEDDVEEISVPTTSATRYSVTRSVSTRVNKRTDDDRNDMRVNSTVTSSDAVPAITTRSAADAMEALKQQHRLEMSTEYFYVPERRPMSPRSTTTASPAMAPGVTGSTTPLLITAPSNNYATCLHCPNATNGNQAGAVDGGIIRREVWSIPVLIIAIISLFIMIAFEIFVLCKASQTTPSRRHLFLGQMLLLGLFGCSSLAALITITPTPVICATIRFGIGVAYALVFAALLVKCVFLISLNTGVYLPAPYQGLLLFFAVLIQIVIGIQWLINTPPMIHVISSASASYSTAPAGLLSTASTRHRGHLLVTATATRPESADVVSHKLITLCQTPYVDILMSLIYVICLIIFVAVLAIKSRGIRDNYREATYIGLAVGFTIPLWLMWTLSGLIMIERHRDACLAVGLLTTSLIIFLVMFLPKGRQLAAMGKEGVYVEDRDDRFSSLSRAGSTGYSPSFFHFKPMKYAPAPPAMNAPTSPGGGMMGGTGGLHGGFGSGATSSSHKRHPTTITTLGGDHLALYPAASSYTRMYHCYPCASGIPAALCNPPAPSAMHHHHYTPTPGSIFVRSDDGNVYTTLEPTLSSNPNVYFQRGSGLLHPGMMY